MAETLKQKTIKGASWSFVEQILTRGVNFVIGIILARLLSPTDYGLVGMMGVFIAISQIFVDGGLANALIQTKNPTDKDFSTVFIVNMTLSFVFYCILYFTAPLVANFYEQPLLKPLMRVVALILIIVSLSSIHGTLLSIRVDFKTKSIISIASSLLSGGIGIYCAYKGLGAWALVAQSVASATIITLLTLAFVHWMPKLVFSKESFKRLFSYSSKLLAASVINVAYDNAYPMVIGKRFTAADVGQYTRAGQFPLVANNTITGALNRVAFPVLSQIQDDNERLLNVYEKYIQLSSFLIFPVLLWLCGCARPLVSFLLTDKWLDCVPLMQILCFSLLTNGITLINLNLLYVKGRSDLVLRLEIIKKTIAFIILFVSMLFSLKVMCYGQVLYSIIALCLNTIYTKKILGYGLFRQLKVIYPYFLLALVVLAVSLLISNFVSHRVLALVLSFGAGAVVYFLLNKIFRLYAYQEARELVLSKLRK